MTPHGDWQQHESQSRPHQSLLARQKHACDGRGRQQHQTANSREMLIKQDGAPCTDVSTVSRHRTRKSKREIPVSGDTDRDCNQDDAARSRNRILVNFTGKHAGIEDNQNDEQEIRSGTNRNEKRMSQLGTRNPTQIHRLRMRWIDNLSGCVGGIVTDKTQSEKNRQRENGQRHQIGSESPVVNHFASASDVDH